MNVHYEVLKTCHKLVNVTKGKIRLQGFVDVRMKHLGFDRYKFIVNHNMNCVITISLMACFLLFTTEMYIILSTISLLTDFISYTRNICDPLLFIMTNHYYRKNELLAHIFFRHEDSNGCYHKKIEWLNIDLCLVL